MQLKIGFTEAIVTVHDDGTGFEVTFVGRGLPDCLTASRASGEACVSKAAAVREPLSLYPSCGPPREILMLITFDDEVYVRGAVRGGAVFSRTARWRRSPRRSASATDDSTLAAELVPEGLPACSLT